eukprot:611279_1
MADVGFMNSCGDVFDGYTIGIVAATTTPSPTAHPTFHPSTSPTQTTSAPSASPTVYTGYGYVGCFADDDTRAFEYWPEPQVPGFTAGECYSICINSDYKKYFGLQNGGECFCSNSYDLATQYGTSSNCPPSQLGDIWANDVFEIYQTPTATPTKHPTDSPTLHPSTSPTTAHPTTHPTVHPTTAYPTAYPTAHPSTAHPTAHPTVHPTTTRPTIHPTVHPATVHPTSHPTTASPTVHPSVSPTTTQPTIQPSTHPTTANPTAHPITAHPTLNPTIPPTVHPTVSTVHPTNQPTFAPITAYPTVHPTTVHPTVNPSIHPTTTHPTIHPTMAPTTAYPTTAYPTLNPTISLTSANPTVNPTIAPTTVKPTVHPITAHPTLNPTITPTTGNPTVNPTIAPTTVKPTVNPTIAPTSANPTVNPTIAPTTVKPTVNPTIAPTSANPTVNPTIAPTTVKPTVHPITAHPTLNPTITPTTGNPTVNPTIDPTPQPTPYDNYECDEIPYILVIFFEITTDQDDFEDELVEILITVMTNTIKSLIDVQWNGDWCINLIKQNLIPYGNRRRLLQDTVRYRSMFNMNKAIKNDVFDNADFRFNVFKKRFADNLKARLSSTTLIQDEAGFSMDSVTDIEDIAENTTTTKSEPFFDLTDPLMVSLMILVGFSISIMISGKIHARYSDRDDFRLGPVFLFSIYVWDFYTDLLFAMSLYTTYVTPDTIDYMVLFVAS